MRKKIVTIFATILLSCCVTKAQDKKVAVFDPAGKAKDAIKEIVREEISTVIVNTTGYTVLERELIDKVLAESKFQQSGLVDDAQIGEMGKRMGADYVFVSTLTPLGEDYHMSFKIIDVTTARIEKQKTVTSKGLDNLTELTQLVIKDMLGYDVKLQLQAILDSQQNPPSQSSESENVSQTVNKEVRKGTSTVPVSTYTKCGFQIMSVDLPREYNYYLAMRACPEGWRLPTIQELECICEDQTSIEGLKGEDSYWSSTVKKEGKKALIKTFNDCETEVRDMKRENSCRCVRDK